MTQSERRLVQARQALAEARTYAEAIAVLLTVDTDTLAQIEKDYCFLPAAASTRRERIARSHVRLILAVHDSPDSGMHTTGVTSRVVHGWAQGTLTEWLEGYTDSDDGIGGQYRVRLVEEPGEHGAVYEVTTVEGHDPRRFRVEVVVREQIQ